MWLYDQNGSWSIFCWSTNPLPGIPCSGLPNCDVDNPQSWEPGSGWGCCVSHTVEAWCRSCVLQSSQHHSFYSRQTKTPSAGFGQLLGLRTYYMPQKVPSLFLNWVCKRCFFGFLCLCLQGEIIFTLIPCCETIVSVNLPLFLQENIEVALEDTETSTSLSVAVVDQASSQALVSLLLSFHCSLMYFYFLIFLCITLAVL